MGRFSHFFLFFTLVRGGVAAKQMFGYIILLARKKDIVLHLFLPGSLIQNGYYLPSCFAHFIKYSSCSTTTPALSIQVQDLRNTCTCIFCLFCGKIHIFLLARHLSTQVKYIWIFLLLLLLSSLLSSFATFSVRNVYWYWCMKIFYLL